MDRSAWEKLLKRQLDQGQILYVHNTRLDKDGDPVHSAFNDDPQTHRACVNSSFGGWRKAAGSLDNKGLTRTVDKPAAAPKVEKPLEAPQVAASSAKPNDDLTTIEGIGAKTAKSLVKIGITSFIQLSKLKPEDIKAKLKAKGTNLIGDSVQSWPMQAQLAAEGDTDGLKKLQDKLKGGKL